MKAMAFIPVAAIVLAGCGGSPAVQQETPTVLVGTIRPRQGSLPETVTAYGLVVPATNGTQTLSSAQPGQVTTLFVAPGVAVRAGQPLALFVTAPTARSSYQQAADALIAARKQRATTAQLLSQQLATRDQLAQAEKAVADAQTALAALQAEGAGAAQRTLRAPFDGVVTTIAVAQGERTQAGAPILTVARAGGIVVTVGVDPAERSRLTIGQPANILRLSGGPSIAGRVIRLDSTLNAKTRMVDVDLSFAAGALLPGEATQVAIETGRVAGWIVPHASVVTSGGPPRIFQIASTRAKAVPVTIAMTTDRSDVVRGRIDPGLPLIVSGAYQVNDGDAVRQGH